MLSQPTGEDPALKSLLRRWRAVTLVCLLILASGFWFLRLEWRISFAWRWLFLTIWGITYLLAVLRRNLASNHRPGETQILPTFGLGNILSILRGIFLSILFGFLFSPPPEGWIAWIPGIFYTLAITADFFDGFVARVTRRATRLGEHLDLSLDGVGVLVASALAIQYGQVPGWYLGVPLARYLFLAGTWLRARLGKPNYELPPSISRRGFAGLQMGFLAVILWPLFSPPGTHIAAAVFALPFLAGFLRDWLHVSGMLKPVLVILAKYPGWVSRWLPVGLRLVILGLLAYQISWDLNGIPDFSQPIQVLALVEVAVALLVGAGAAIRFTAISGLVLLGFHQIQASLSPVQMILVLGYTAVLFMGGGMWSIWKPEDGLIFRRAGEQLMAPMERGG